MHKLKATKLNVVLIREHANFSKVGVRVGGKSKNSQSVELGTCRMQGSMIRERKGKENTKGIPTATERSPDHRK